MVEILIWVLLIDVVLLIVLPLEKIGRWQTKVREWWKKLVDKAKA